MIKLFIVIIALAGIMRLPVHNSILWFRDAYCIFIVLLNMTLSFGNTYGIIMLLSFGLFCIFIYIFNMYNEIFVDNINEDNNKYLILISALSQRNKELMKLVGGLQTKNEDIIMSARGVIYRLHNYMNENNFSSEIISEELEFLTKLLQKPVVDTREKRIFDNPRNDKIRRRQIRQIEDILKTYNLGPSFDRALTEELKRLRKENSVNVTNNRTNSEQIKS